jgi:hypothetical protein
MAERQRGRGVDRGESAGNDNEGGERMTEIPRNKICNRCGERYGVHVGTTCRDGCNGNFDNKDEQPVTEFKAGHWYIWVGPKKRRADWNNEPDESGQRGMDFILDGKPHRCTEGFGALASFPESPSPEHCWRWSDGLEYFREVPAPGKKEDTASLNCRCSVGPITINFPDGSLKTLEGFSEPKKVSSKAQRRREILARLKIE